MILSWIFFTLPPLLTWGYVKNPIKPETTYSTINAAEFTGPTDLCLVLGLAIGDYSISSPSSGEYTWLLQEPDGNTTTVAKGGAGSISTIQIRYTKTGTYQVILEERLNPTAPPTTTSIAVEVSSGPTIILKPDYLVCGENIPTLQAMDSSDSDLGKYEFTWARDEEFSSVVKVGVGSTGNEFIPNDEGFYYVRLTPTGSNAVCQATASTYVGPPVDFRFVQNNEEICEEETVRIGLDTPISGRWWYRLQGEADKIELGSSYAVTLGNTQFTESGVYEIGFIANDPDYSCPSERITTVRVKEGPKLETADIIRPTVCGANDGSFKIIVEKDLIALRVSELNLDLGAQPAGAEITVPDLEAGVYTIEAANTECEGFSFHALNLSASLDETEIVPYKEECILNGTNVGKVEITFPNGDVTGEYRILSGNSGISIYGRIEDGDFLTVDDLPGGIYFFDFEHDGNECHPLIKTFQIDRRRDVPFYLPEVINICETYDLDLQSDIGLIFTLTQPDGTDLTASSGGSLAVSQEGLHSLYIEPIDPDSDYCAVVREFTLDVLDSQVIFDYEVVEENCAGGQRWSATVENLSSEDAIFRWYNSSSGEIVGRSQEFLPAEFGEVYQLTVQPRGMAACHPAPLDIQFTQPILNVPAELSSEEECGVYFLNLEVSENEDQVTWIEWFLFLEDGSNEKLAEGTGLYELSDDREGIYEAILYRDKQSGDRCEIARVHIPIEASVSTPRPDMEDSYPFCSKGNGIPAIGAGEYESYTWRYLTGDVIVGTDQTFNPSQAGRYELTVLSVEGCIYTEEFRVYDVCDVDYVFPNAMIVGDQNRDFRVTVSEGVSEAELYVFNSTGELIHHDLETEIGFQSPILIWDGAINGKPVPQGTYAVVLILKNPEYGLDEKVTGSLLVLE